MSRAQGHESPEQEPVIENSNPPSSLTQNYAQREWNDTTAQLITSKVLKTTDLRALEFYCIAYQTVIMAADEIDSSGLTVTGNMGGLVVNPACAIQSRALAEARQ